jgi:3-deoxy-7-phosphoheptulonate synthase
MSFPSTENLNVVSFEAMPSPQDLHQRVPLTDEGAQFVAAARATLCRVLDRSDPRLLVIVGPCSIHDPAAGLDYARRLRELAAEVKDSLCLVMRVYFEKPRTVTGWKGFINDPDMDDSFHIEEGMERARRFLVDLTALGLPAATEALDPAAPQYLGDLIAWYAIGARTSESQTHREMASGLSAPVGFKNATDGNIGIAINAIRSAREPHSFLGIAPDGTQAIVRTRGNRYGHIVLRGGQTPNYDTAQVALTEQALLQAGLSPNLVID